MERALAWDLANDLSSHSGPRRYERHLIAMAAWLRCGIDVALLGIDSADMQRRAKGVAEHRADAVTGRGFDSAHIRLGLRA